jgi:hypothetical protein
MILTGTHQHEPAQADSQQNESVQPDSHDTKRIPERVAHNRRETRQLLGGVSAVTLWRWDKQGLLCPIPGLRHKLYARKAIDRFAGRTAR